ncbi:MAG: helix-turn-helix transcriptional regulator [Oscillospiraceae bacterium]|nr:helix-turn-helix transcriptional regulator [Oscillospiraceae bacterium]
MEFKDRLRELRQTKGFTQTELADAIQTTKQAISQYERGVRRPDLDTLAALGDCFNVSTDYLLGKSDVTLRLVDSEGIKALEETSRYLREDQKAILDAFNELTAENQDIIRNIMNQLKGK